ncbi:unnamed protein product [Cylicocyclus nassatus]|uniref:Core-2/I-Branching enzyme n=1 Tax=Cylicocyclus nassatus TaxID=53992 RepID=A0AA36H9S6_CYLNA|nr:unnamed protein product [Cylicocyclus nassatus]
MPEFHHKVETKHVLCDKVLSGDKAYIKELTQNRSVLRNSTLDMSCKEIKARVLPPKVLKKMEFGVAYARVVHESYTFVEDEVRSSYHQQNIFCFSVGAKPSADFYSRIKALSRCLPNVLLSPVRYNISRHGYNMNFAHYDCLKLLNRYTGWQYVLLLQNYDMVIKTVYETVSILKELGGANDNCVRPCESDRWNQSFSWDARSLKLFRNETQASPKQLAAELPEIRGIVQSSLSRAAVDWAVRSVDLTTLIYQLNSDVRGIDETLWATLQMSDDLEMPGRFTGKCISGQTYVPCISRSELNSLHETYTLQD